MVNYERLPLGNPPHEFNMVVEIPKDGTHKYEYDHELGVFFLDRPLYSSVHYPGEYGFIPQTLAEDGDPLDCLVKIDKPTFPGCVIHVRPIGVLKMLDKGEPDHKILAVPTSDPRTAHTFDISDISAHYADEINHFFKVYKELENKIIATHGWQPREVAKTIIQEALDRYNVQGSHS